MAKFALLALGAKKAADLWQSRGQPSPPSLMQRLAIPARLLLGAVGVGGAAYYANEKGWLSQIKQKAGRSGASEQAASFTDTSGGLDTVQPIQPAEPPPAVVDAHPTPTVPPASPGSTL